MRVPEGRGSSGLEASLNTPVEALEYAYPFRVRRYGYREHSGGRAKHRGGDGLVREIELLADCQVILLSDRRRFRPYGLRGGDPGQSGRAVHSSGSESREIPAKATIFAKTGDCILIETPGGGWGKPDVDPGSR